MSCFPPSPPLPSSFVLCLDALATASAHGLAIVSFMYETKMTGRREQVSQVLGNDEKAPLPTDNVFAVQNYHQESSAQDPGELFRLQQRHQPEKNVCRRVFLCA